MVNAGELAYVCVFCTRIDMIQTHLIVVWFSSHGNLQVYQQDSYMLGCYLGVPPAGKTPTHLTQSYEVCRCACACRFMKHMISGTPQL